MLSALPLVSAGNICCCLWIVSGGVVAAYLLQSGAPSSISVGDGALVGLLAGVIGSVVYLVLSIPINLVAAPFERALMRHLLQTAGTMPSGFRDYVGGYARGVIGTLIGFVAMLFAGSVFSTLGGLLGVALFRRPSPPSAPRPADSAGLDRMPDAL